MFEGKKILITGGTGSLGKELTKRLLQMKIDTIRILSRNEEKQISMESELDDQRLRFLLGDIRDLPRLERALEDIDIVFHAAALKHVPKIEYNPFEAVKTNVIGSQNVIDASLKQNVEKVIAIGTDKAVSPFNTYGATKLLMEKLFVDAGNYTNPKKHRTKFIALRYGNVLGSSGSVIPKFIDQIKNNKKITITHPDMTRFSITMNEALDFIIESTVMGVGGEVIIPKLRAYSITDVKESLFELLKNTGYENVGIREGEKLHEVLISEYEVRDTWETDNKYVLTNSMQEQQIINSYSKKLVRPNNLNKYSSDFAERIGKEELKEIIKSSGILN
jgi:UDP-N-acetylglucosamine 4,6-dehydratase/UDP-glucose 4-epimerase